jgi:hypothetical protein
LATRRIEMDDPDLLPTEKIEVEDPSDDTVEEGAEPWGEDTEIEAATDRAAIPSTAIPRRARGVFERLDRAGVKAREGSSGSVRAGRNRRSDREMAQRFDRAYRLLTQGDLEGAFYVFTELLEERPDSTRLWIFVRAISQAKTAGE